MEDQIKEAVDLACQTLEDHGYDIPDEIECRFDLRGHTAGMYCRRGDDIYLRFNLEIANNYPEDYVNRTVPHEVAHLAVGCNFQREPAHGRKWKQAMGVLKADSSVRHRYKTTSARKTFAYTCGCESKEHQISGVRHRKMRERGVQYLCKLCRKEITEKTDERL